MKALTLNLKKNIYILESDIQNPNHLEGYIDSELNEHKIKFICKGSEFPALKEFTENVEAQGYYWGENPIEFDNDVNDFDKRCEMRVNWEKAESKTFNLSKTLIFEIL